MLGSPPVCCRNSKQGEHTVSRVSVEHYKSGEHGVPYWSTPLCENGIREKTRSTNRISTECQKMISTEYQNRIRTDPKIEQNETSAKAEKKL